MAGGAVAGKSDASLKQIFKHTSTREFILVTSLFFLWGFCYGLLDVLNKHFQNVLDITKLESTGLQVAYFGFGYLCFSPVAGEVLRQRGYKTTILMGLSLYSLGAILFWPCAHYAETSNPNAIFAGFVICTAITASGLATLEVSANSYVTVMPGPSSMDSNCAAFRLNFSQSFNGVASFAGPLIASKYFFTGENANNLTNVQFVYMAVASMGVIVGILFVVSHLPEVSEAELQQQALALAEDSGVHSNADGPFRKQYRAIFGFVAHFCYVGAQVTIGTFFLNYVVENSGKTDAEAANLLSYSLILFTVFRFVMTGVLAFVAAPVVLFTNALLGTVLTVLIATLSGTGGLVCIMMIYCLMSCMYPVIFVLSTTGLGQHTRRAASLLVMGVAGGAVFPPAQGAIADHFGTRPSFGIAVPLFAFVTFFAAYVFTTGDRQIFLKSVPTEEKAAFAGSTYPASGTAYKLDKNSHHIEETLDDKTYEKA